MANLECVFQVYTLTHIYFIDYHSNVISIDQLLMYHLVMYNIVNLLFNFFCQLGGPKWSVPLGRRDSTTANQTEANNLPSPFENITSLISKFAAKGLNAQELTVLSGSHTVGSSACFAFRTRVWGTEPNINPPFAIARRKNCPASGGDNNLSPLTTPNTNRFC